MRRGKTVGIIQARMSSSRLPGKMMMDLCGYPVIQWVIERCQRSRFLDTLILATTVNIEDDCLCTVAAQLGIPVYRGDVDDVLMRFINAAQQYEADVVVRICADNPLVAAGEIDRLVRFVRSKKPDYAFNHVPADGNNYPDGLGAEAVPTGVLEKIARMTNEKKYREHVTLYLREHAHTFNILTFPCPPPYNHPLMKLDIDTIDDLQRMRRICRDLSFNSAPAAIFKQWSWHARGVESS